jgi:hypothetical protein
MKRIIHWILIAGAAIGFILGCASFFSASLVYDEAERWFARATYNAECTTTADTPGCTELSLQQPTWPFGVEVTDKDVLLAEASAFHNTGSGVLALSGLFMAMSGVLLAGAAFTHRSSS